jgi:lipopolysaccharide transport system permease protein
LATAVRGSGGFDLRPGPTPPGMLLRDIWQARGLVRSLSRKNFYVRYRRATLGFVWAGIMPLLQALAITLAFSVVLKVRAATAYPVFVFSGLAGWNYYSGTLSSASTAIVDSASMASRIYFPRAINVLVQVATALYGYAISMVILLAVALIAGDGLTYRALLLVPATVLVVWLTAALALCIAAMHVYVRDLRYAVGAMTAALFYLTPVAYPFERIPEHLRWIIILNPATGVVQLYRAALIQPAPPLWLSAAGVSILWAAAATGLALYLHCRNDRNFADLL